MITSQISDDYGIINDYALRHLHNSICKDAQRSYPEALKPKAKTYTEGSFMKDAECSSVVWQTRARTYLSRLCLEQFTTSDVDIETTPPTCARA